MGVVAEVSGNVAFPDGVRGASIRVDTRTGLISEIKDTGEASGSEELIFPGFVDAHVHAREYPRPASPDLETSGKWYAASRKEVFTSAGFAALNGGVTLYGAMPNDPDPPDTEAAYRSKLRVAEASPCPTVLFAAVTHHSEPWGDVPYKVYLDRTRSSVSFDDWSELESALARYRGVRLFFHAEDPEVLKRTGGEGPRWKNRPVEAESRAVAKILELTGKLGLNSHICHVSAEESVRLINEFNRSSSSRVTCEATPHHLFFSVDSGVTRGASCESVPAAALLECNPPLRSEKDRSFLVEALREGLVDMVASDHAPHTLADKDRGAPGMPHLDTMGAFAGWLMKECGFDAQRISRVLSSEPARLFSPNLENPHGVLEPGAVASFTCLSLHGQTLVKDNEIVGRGRLQTRCGWSPFDGIPLPAAVTRVVVKGNEFAF